MKRVKNLAGPYTCLAFTSLAIGILFYLYGRNTPTLFEQALGLSNVRATLRLNGWITDYLFGVSLFCAMAAAWTRWSHVPATWKWIVFLMLCATEGLQYVQLISGTGDLYDIAAYVLSFASIPIAEAILMWRTRPYRLILSHHHKKTPV